MYSSGVAPLLYFGGGRERGGREKKEVLGHDGTSSWIHWTVERRGGARGGGGMAKRQNRGNDTSSRTFSPRCPPSEFETTAAAAAAHSIDGNSIALPPPPDNGAAIDGQLGGDTTNRHRPDSDTPPNEHIFFTPPG